MHLIGSNGISILEEKGLSSWSLSSLQRTELDDLSRQAEQLFARRAGPDVAARALKAIVACYRVAELAEPAVFLGGAVTAIEDFPAAVVERLGSFKFGIVRQAKFIPTIAELVAWCEAEEKRIRSNVDAVEAVRVSRDSEARRKAEEAEARKRREQERLEWEAGEPERRRKAEEAERLAKQAAEKHARQEAQASRRRKAQGAVIAGVCAAAKDNAAATEYAFELLADDDIANQATEYELQIPGMGARFILAKMPIPATADSAGGVSANFGYEATTEENRPLAMP